MSDRSFLKINRWPFLLGDALLIGLAVVMVTRNPERMSPWEALIVLTAVIIGAWLAILPSLREHEAALKLTEADALATTVAQIRDLERIQNQITNATSQWQSVQQQSAQTAATAREAADRMKAEMAEFSGFLQKANDNEKSHLRLEVEKSRRSERDWLQAAVTVLDHIFALHVAGTRSGQPALARQLSQFQAACRDAMRRLGLVGFAPGIGDSFDSQVHQLEDAPAELDQAAAISEVLALGYTYRGELVRRALVRVKAETAEKTEPELAAAEPPTTLNLPL